MRRSNVQSLPPLLAFPAVTDLEAVMACRAVADGQAAADEVVLDVDDDEAADGTDDLR